jgi:hypothetical protein
MSSEDKIVIPFFVWVLGFYMLPDFIMCVARYIVSFWGYTLRDVDNLHDSEMAIVGPNAIHVYLRGQRLHGHWLEYLGHLRYVRAAIALLVSSLTLARLMFAVKSLHISPMDPRAHRPTDPRAI